MIAKAIEVLFSAYRRADFADAAGFVTQLGVVFEDYPDNVIAAVTSPRTGLQRTCKFPPSIAEIVERCEREAAEQHRVREQRQLYGGRPVPLPGPREPTMTLSLCRKFGIRGVPRGWDAIDVTREAAKHGAEFPRIIDEMLGAQPGSPTAQTPVSKIVSDAKRAMGARHRQTEADDRLAA